jgi:hypothetical protein
MRKSILSGAAVSGICAFVFGLGLIALPSGAAAKLCSAPIPKINGGGLCIANCQFGCGVHVNNAPGASPNHGCSQYCFDRNGRMIDNVKFDRQGRQIVTPVTPVTPVKPATNQPSGTSSAPPCQPGKSATPFGDNCITVRPPTSKSGPPPM